MSKALRRRVEALENLQRSTDPDESILYLIYSLAPSHLYPAINGLGLSPFSTIGEFKAEWNALGEAGQSRLRGIGAKRRARIQAAVDRVR